MQRAIACLLLDDCRHFLQGISERAALALPGAATCSLSEKSQDPVALRGPSRATLSPPSTTAHASKDGSPKLADDKLVFDIARGVIKLDGISALKKLGWRKLAPGCCCWLIIKIESCCAIWRTSRHLFVDISRVSTPLSSEDSEVFLDHFSVWMGAWRCKPSVNHQCACLSSQTL